MTTADPPHRIADASLPADWRGEVESRLESDEQVLAALEHDLDERLRFASGLLVLTDRRLLATGADRSSWRSWPLQPGQAL